MDNIYGYVIDSLISIDIVNNVIIEIATRFYHVIIFAEEVNFNTFPISNFDKWGQKAKPLYNNIYRILN